MSVVQEISSISSPPTFSMKNIATIEKKDLLNFTTVCLPLLLRINHTSMEKSWVSSHLTKIPEKSPSAVCGLNYPQNSVALCAVFVC